MSEFKMTLFRNKFLLTLFVVLPMFCFSESYEKLASEYLITYGKDNADINVTYLFSIYCPSCLKFIKKEFPDIKKKYIDTGKVKWTWHPFPNPEKPLTYQAMLCWERLSNNERRIFLENCAHYLNEKTLVAAPEYFKSLMRFFGQEVPDLYSKEFLLNEKGKREASKFISQDVHINIPSIEVNGEYFSKFPSFRFIESQIERELNKVK